MDFIDKTANDNQYINGNKLGCDSEYISRRSELSTNEALTVPLAHWVLRRVLDEATGGSKNSHKKPYDVNGIQVSKN